VLLVATNGVVIFESEFVARGNRALHRPVPLVESSAVVPVAVRVLVRFPRIPLIQNRTDYPRSVVR
jgi:hypothetical protein